MRAVAARSHRKPNHDPPKQKLANPSSRATSSCNPGRGPCSPDIDNWATKIGQEHCGGSIWLCKTCHDNKQKRVNFSINANDINVHYSQQTEWDCLTIDKVSISRQAGPAFASRNLMVALGASSANMAQMPLPAQNGWRERGTNMFESSPSQPLLLQGTRGTLEIYGHPMNSTRRRRVQELIGLQCAASLSNGVLQRLCLS